MVEEMIAEKMARDMKEVSVAEFFEKNRHLLGYENTTKSLLTVVKEAIDNSLDATTEAGILPDLFVSVKQLSADRFKVIVQDNGPGIVHTKVPNAFGKFLYGSKFHRLRQSRGVQGLGIHGAVLYNQLTTGKPAKIRTSTGKDIHNFELMIDVLKNEPHVVNHWKEKNPDKWHGVRIELELEGRYIERSQSIPEYVRQTAIANPYAKIVFDGPNGKEKYKRGVNKLPPQPKEIKPHPYGVEIGIMRRMLATTRARNLIGFLMSDFSRVGRRSGDQILRLAKLKPSTKPKELTHADTVRLHKAMQMVKLVSPRTNCLSPLGDKLITEGLKKELPAEHFVAVSRKPSVYRGMPFIVEVGLAYGGELPTDQTANILRFANKVPLLYHQSDCAITKSIQEVDWRRYGLSQSTGSAPKGPITILVHFASVWVPFTSEGKQAIAKYDEIIKEIKLALQDAGRAMAKYIRQQRRAHQRQLRRKLFERYIPEVSDALSQLSGTKSPTIVKGLEKILKKNNKDEGIEPAKEKPSEGVEEESKENNENEEEKEGE